MLRRLAFLPRGWIVWGAAALLLAAACGVTLPAWADDAPGNRATLKGIPAVKVVVAPTILEGEWDRLRTDQLETDVERRLREAGITLLPSATEVLYIEVEARKTSGSPRYACSTRVELLQSVSLVREPGLTVFAPTWGLGRVEEVSAYNLRSLRVTVGELVDSFIQAYREQNPKR